jgi:hypothetical protein
MSWWITMPRIIRDWSGKSGRTASAPTSWMAWGPGKPPGLRRRRGGLHLHHVADIGNDQRFSSRQELHQGLMDVLEAIPGRVNVKHGERRRLDQAKVVRVRIAASSRSRPISGTGWPGRSAFCMAELLYFR